MSAPQRLADAHFSVCLALTAAIVLAVVQISLLGVSTSGAPGWALSRVTPHAFQRMSIAPRLGVVGHVAIDAQPTRDTRPTRRSPATERPLLPVIFLTGTMIVVVVLYFTPSIVATVRGHENKLAIFALNLFLGWSILGWVGALVWSLTAVRRPQ
jgi:hypothetical protein